MNGTQSTIFLLNSSELQLSLETLMQEMTREVLDNYEFKLRSVIFNSISTYINRKEDCVLETSLCIFFILSSTCILLRHYLV